MRNAVDVQLANGSIDASRHHKTFMTVSLWTIQGMLALTFLFAGSMKLVMPIEMMVAQMSVPLPGLFLKFIGVAEVTGAFGLILPGLLRIRPGLTPLAGACLSIIMIGAIVVTLLGNGGVAAALPLVVGLLCVTVAYGRRSWRLV